MGFTVAGPDQFLGSGHPDPREPGPPHLGLVVSTDRAQTWRPVSLGGEADFHSLVAVGDRVYGWDSTSGSVLASDDGGQTWTQGATVAAADLAVDPDQPGRVLATTAEGLLGSDDGGRTFAAVQPQPPALLAHVEYVNRGREPAALAGIASDGAVLALMEGRWSEIGQLAGPPEAFSVARPDYYLAATAAGVFVSEDGGRSWQLLAKTEHG